MRARTRALPRKFPRPPRFQPSADGFTLRENEGILQGYEYSPFGTLSKSHGPRSAENPWRFSTKYFDDATELSYFGRRYFDGSLGRWLNRDPIGERGGFNLSAFDGNDPVGTFDSLGLRVKGGCLDSYVSKYLEEWIVSSSEEYIAGAGVIGNRIEGKILRAMFEDPYLFKIAGSTQSQRLSNLKIHVDARATLVDYAERNRFSFPDSNTGPATGRTYDGFSREDCYDAVNHPGTVVYCNQALAIMFEYATGTSRAGLPQRAAGTWIPGDWGYVKNQLYREGDPASARFWGIAQAGENVMYLSDGRFFGLAGNNTPRIRTADQWLAAVNNFLSLEPDPDAGVRILAVAGWGDRVRFPPNGLVLP